MRRVPIPGVGAHARDRAAERLGRDLTREEWLAAVACIVERRAALLCVMPNGSEHYLHEIGGVSLRLVWRPDLALVVTAMAAESAPAEIVRRVTREGRVRSSLRVPARTFWAPGGDD